MFTISNIANADLTTGLVAYYPFNGNANDEIGNGNNGTVHGTTLTADRFGKENKAYYFDVVNNSISAPASSTLSVSKVTLAVWINTTGWGTWYPRIVAVGPSGSWFACMNISIFIANQPLELATLGTLT